MNKRFLMDTIEQLAQHGVGSHHAARLLGYSRAWCCRLARDVGAPKHIGGVHACPSIPDTLAEQCRVIREREPEPPKVCACGGKNHSFGKCRRCYARDNYRDSHLVGRRRVRRGGYINITPGAAQK